MENIEEKKTVEEVVKEVIANTPEINPDSVNSSDKHKKLIAYTDGSYDKKSKLCALGVVFIDAETGLPFEYLKNSIDELGYCNMRNVGGEIKAAEKAMAYAKKYNYDELEIHYDYKGVEDWPTGKWKTNNEYTEKYVEYYQTISTDVKIKFVHVKAHSHDTFNDMADKLAKDALNLFPKNSQNILAVKDLLLKPNPNLKSFLGRKPFFSEK